MHPIYPLQMHQTSRVELGENVCSREGSFSAAALVNYNAMAVSHRNNMWIFSMRYMHPKITMTDYASVKIRLLRTKSFFKRTRGKEFGIGFTVN